MANAIFTTKVQSSYDDLPEFRYHFPATYLNYAEQAVGDWIVYYEPRRESTDLSSRAGRQAYFAIAQVNRIERDPLKHDHYYAYLSDYLEFTTPVPFKNGVLYFEAALQKSDGTTNKGAFGRSVRILKSQEFELICQAGFNGTNSHAKSNSEVFVFSEDSVPYGRSVKVQLTERKFREAAFTQTIQRAYNKTCAMTGLRLIEGDNRCEIEAAHIRPVENEGPDSPRNGIALSRTVHWLFDRGFLSLTDDGTILVAEKYVPEKVQQLIVPSRKILAASDFAWKPHVEFIRYHRQTLFKG